MMALRSSWSQGAQQRNCFVFRYVGCLPKPSILVLLPTAATLKQAVLSLCARSSTSLVFGF